MFVVDIEQSLRLAQKLDAARGGMASVKIEYNPYEHLWTAYASWSSGKHEYGQGNNLTKAVGILNCILLRAAAESVREEE